MPSGEERHRITDLLKTTLIVPIVLGTPTTERVAATDNQLELARRRVEEIVDKAIRADVRVAIEVIPNQLSSGARLVHLIEEELGGLSKSPTPAIP